MDFNPQCDYVVSKPGQAPSLHSSTVSTLNLYEGISSARPGSLFPWRDKGCDTGKKRNCSLVWRQTYRAQYSQPPPERAISPLLVVRGCDRRIVLQVVEDELRDAMPPNLFGGERVERELQTVVGVLLRPRFAGLV